MRRNTRNSHWACIRSNPEPCHRDRVGTCVYCSVQVQDSTASRLAVALDESSVRCSTNLQLGVEASRYLKMSCLPAWT